ncbi:sodium-dependent nutrient amino acid transporter, putative [Pediculus humanus corporis]|uniref:Transporter n=1 Tax=Pediculus humanus subsp. corporis TaxID=121224 RepID=E0W047_PEDHC|nr:sodium-dependent nutrient amino acid transporter, putative [Pediculus humanus corporis]EEB19003.1 sodium-dependent nutrient amino acid transporter, putative [Pediculus humanus corporis]
MEQSITMKRIKSENYWKPNNNDDAKSSHEKVDIKQDPERGGWSSKLNFLFSCISVSVGLGNVWRFPYLCHKNGGGAFLITYFIAMIFCGIPVFFQEVAIGQYLGCGGMTLVGNICPLLQGTGYATMTIVFLLDVYYCIIIAWTLFYLLSTFTVLPDLPWQSCGNWWNTDNCFDGSNSSENMGMENSMDLTNNHTTTPVEEYWLRRVLMLSNGITDIGGMQWELFGLLFLAWIIVYLIIAKGLNQSGKIIWFTALFPYAIFLILLFYSVTLTGAIDGLKYFITPDWSKLTTAGAWIDGSTQIFFAYSLGVGTLPALGSYNNFRHNCYKDAVVTCIVNTFTCILAGIITFSILGYLAHIQHTDVEHVVASGPGLVFITYPEVVLQLPGAPIWSAIFFFMLMILGVDSLFCNVESFVTGVVDHWSHILRPHRKKFTLGVCLIMFALGIPMVTHGGTYIFQIMDFYSASGMCLLWVCFFQTIAISWVFGAEKFVNCIKEMTGKKPGLFWVISWKFLAPSVMLGVFFFFCIKYEPVTYANVYHYPWWGEVIGLILSFSSMIWIPGYAIYYLIKTPGSFKEKIKKGLTAKLNLLQKSKPTAVERQNPILMTESQVVLINQNIQY